MVKYTLCLHCDSDKSGTYVYLEIQKDFEMPALPGEKEAVLVGQGEFAGWVSVDHVWHHPLEGRITVECQIQPIYLLFAVKASTDWRYTEGSQKDWKSLQACARGETSLDKLGWE